MTVHSDGFCSFVFDFSIGFIEKVLDPQMSQYEALQAFSNDYDLHFKVDNFLEVGLVSLSVINTQVKERKDLC